MIERLPLPPNLGSLHGLLDGEGYLVMLPTRYARWVRALEPEEMPGATAETVAAFPLHQLAALRSPLLTGSSVRHLLSRVDVVAELTAQGGDAAGWRERLPAHGELRIFENDRAALLAFVVAEARFLPEAPHDDAIGTAAEGFAGPITADATARAAWHAAVLADLATEGDGVALSRHAWFEAAPSPRPDPSIPPTTTSLRLADGTTLTLPMRRIDGPPCAVAAIERTATRWRITLAPGDGGFLVVNDGYEPGWRATVDGVATPVVPCNVAWRGVVLRKDAREVVLEHAPAEVSRGLALAGGAVLVLVLLSAAGLVSAARGRRPTRAARPPAP
jgi:hypothetical protein